MIPSVETQLMLNEATQNIYKISFDEWYTERRLFLDLLVQHDIRSAQHFNNSKYLISAHHKRLTIDTPNKNFDFAMFNNLDLRKYYVEIHGQRCPRDSVLINCEENEYIQQYKVSNFFWNLCRRTNFKPSCIISGHENKLPY